MTETWTYIAQPSGRGHHRIFRNNRGEISICDCSGATPADTDDGPCYIEAGQTATRVEYEEDGDFRYDDPWYYSEWRWHIRVRLNPKHHGRGVSEGVVTPTQETLAWLIARGYVAEVDRGNSVLSRKIRRQG